MQMRDELTTATYAARAGGAIIRSLFGQDLAAREKRGADLVTEADQAAEATILAVLRAAHPDFGIISEECGALPGTAGYTWVVDPLDGTNNVVAGIPQVGVSIALLPSEEAVLDVTYQPMADVLWQARRGEGARRNGHPIAVATRQDDLGRATVAYVHGYLADDGGCARLVLAGRGADRRRSEPGFRARGSGRRHADRAGGGGTRDRRDWPALRPRHDAPARLRQ